MKFPRKSLIERLNRKENVDIEEEINKAALKKNIRIVGTPDYIAPEILNGLLNDKTIDWWSVGVILFEFLVGMPPFNDETPEKVFENIKNHNIPWDQITVGEGEDCISETAFDLINKLLSPDPSKRLGAGGSEEIKAHSFFKGEILIY